MGTHPRFPPKARTGRAATWWGRAWVRGVEEASYGEGDLRRARALARAGAVGGITVGPGEVFAAVEDRRDLWTARVGLPVFAEADRRTYLELVAAEPRHVADLLRGVLPLDLVEHADELGIETLPFSGEHDATCACDAWTQPCVHVLAMLYQCGWLVDDDAVVLLQLRGVAREDLAAGASRPTRTGASLEEDEEVEDELDLDLAVEAALAARAALAELPQDVA